MEVDAKVVADCAQVSTVSVLKWRRKGNVGPEWRKDGGRYHYNLGGLIRWAIVRAVTPLREEIDALRAEVATLIENSPEAKMARLQERLREAEIAAATKIREQANG